MEKGLHLFEDLQYDIRLLENTLVERAYTDHIWPAKDLSEEELHEFADDLHRILWECLAMYKQVDMPVYEPYSTDHTCTAGYISLIEITRAWLRFGQEALIAEYRCPTPAELAALELLQQIHSAMIGQVYGDRPGMETVSADEMRFRS